MSSSSSRSSCSTCSSKIDGSTMAAAPNSSSRRIVSRLALRGLAPAMIGFLRVSPRYEVVRSIGPPARACSRSLRGDRHLRRRWTALEVRKVLVRSIFLDDVGLRLAEQSFRFLWLGHRQRAITQLVIGVVLERHRRAWRVETEWVLANPPHRGNVAEERPIPARSCQILLLHAIPEIVAVRDAVAVGEDQRRALIGFRLPESLQSLL